MTFCASRRWGKRRNGNSAYCAVARLRGCAVARLRGCAVAVASLHVLNSLMACEIKFLGVTRARQVFTEIIWDYVDDKLLRVESADFTNGCRFS